MWKRGSLRNKYNNKNKNNGISTKEAVSNNWYVIKLAWSFHPQRVLAELANTSLRQFETVFYSVVFIKFLIETMESGGSFRDVFTFIVATFLVSALTNFYHQWFNFRFKPISDTIIYEKLYEKLFRKASEIELHCYENSDFYNTYTTAIKEADTRVNEVVSNVFGIIFAAIASVSIFAVMYSIDNMVILFIIFPIIGDLLFGRKTNNFYFRRYMDNVKNYRKMDYVNRTMYLQNYAKEIRLSNIFEVLKSIYYEGYNGVIQVIDHYKNRIMVTDFMRNIFTSLLIFQGVLFYGAYLSMIRKTISIGEFAVLASSMAAGIWIIIHMTERIVKVYENGVFINNLHQFLNYESEIKEDFEGVEPPLCVEEIVFKNVSFSYKGSDRPVIRNINLTIRKNDKIALVGHNGAGKTTFIKLLMRLYDPTEGSITVNGTQIGEYSVKPYRNLFGAVLQDFQIFSMTIAENVLMREPRDVEDRELVKKALIQSGVYDKITTLPNGIDTILTREFDDEGTMLSGGELQKIALARVFASQAEVVIMDEPSSALDPISEYQFYDRVSENCRDKTVIFISHRLSSAIIADKIYLFEDGEIVEEGTHRELMQLGGRYAELFRKQAEKYLESGEISA